MSSNISPPQPLELQKKHILIDDDGNLTLILLIQDQNTKKYHQMKVRANIKNLHGISFGSPGDLVLKFSHPWFGSRPVDLSAAPPTTDEQSFEGNQPPDE